MVKKYKKEETKKNKIRLHPNIVLLTLVLRTVRILTCVCKLSLTVRLLTIK